jgi:hypothetical protein
MRRSKLIGTVAAAALTATTLLGVQSPASSEQPRAAKADTFWCTAGGTYNVVNRTTFGSDGWVQLVGQKPNGTRAIYVFHPSGRNDTYRIRLRSGGSDLVLGPVTQSYHCSALNSGEQGRAEARRAGSGGAYDFAQWRQG